MTMNVPMVEDSLLLMCTMPIIFTMMAHLAENPGGN